MKRQEETECRAYRVLNAGDRIPGFLSHEPMHKKTGGKRIPPYAGSAPWGEAFHIARPVCLPQAGSWAPPGMQGALRAPEPRQQTHCRSLGGSLRAPRLSFPWREPEEKSSFAITPDALMPCRVPDYAE
jgi:hypothetical protein